MSGWIESLPLSVAAGWLLAFVLHATVLLLGVWLIERLGLLKHPGWAEWAWRVALFGAFVSMAVELVPWNAMRASPAAATVVSAPVSRAMTRAMTTSMTAPITAPVANDAQASVAMPMTHAAAAITGIDAADVQAGGFAPVALPLASDAIFIGLALWLSGTLLLLARVLFQAAGLLRLRRRLVREGAPAGVDLQRAMQTLVQEMQVRMPTLRVLSGLSSPLVLPGAVLLPRWAEGLGTPQQRAMLAHELAHLRRRDPLWRPLQRLALVPLFFHPLAWHALRRLETLAETLCDAAAVERSGSGRPLAECLAECLARSSGADRRDPHNTEHRGAGWALAMAERSSCIVDRVHTLLENSQMKLSTIPARWRWTAAVFAVLALIALPGVMVVARPGAISDVFETSALSATFRTGTSKMTIRSDLPTPGERLRVVSDGMVEFNAQENDVARMGRGAKLVIEQTRAGVTRKITITSAMTPAANGFQRTYLVDGTPRPFDADGKAWLAKVIPEIYRTTGIEAEARVTRLLSEGGVPRLLQEIAMLGGDHARAEYLGQLFLQAVPDAAQTAQALAQMNTIKSDFDKRRALTIALQQPRIDAANQVTLLNIARGFGSDFDRAEWLVEATPKLPVQGANVSAWTQSLLAFDSDFERKRALQALIEEGRPREQAVTIALQALRGMGSDFETRSVLESAAKASAAKAGVTLVDADYFKAVDAMSSDFDKREALLALIRGTTPDVARSQRILNSVRGFGSDFERGEVLVALAAAMPNDVALIEGYRAVARGMADFERGQAEKALDRFYRG